MAEVVDADGDVANETPAGAQDSSPVQDNIDIVRAWIGNETVQSFDVGLEVVAQLSTLDANGQFHGIEHRAVEFSADGVRYQVRFDSGCDVAAASVEILSELG